MKMPLSFGDISGIARRHAEPHDTDPLEALLMKIDTANWEQMDQGRDIFMPGGVLSHGQLRDSEKLPYFIRRFREEKDRGISRPYIYDRLWELYYLYAYSTAQSFPCRFLTEYLSVEIDMRAGLAAARARGAGYNPEEHSILVSFRHGDFSGLMNRLKSQPDPLETERLLDEERLKQISRCGGNAPFSLDALLSYLSRAMIYDRWERISQPFNIESYLWHGGNK